MGTDYTNAAVAAIEAQQQAEKGRTPAWMVGEQLKDICRREPACAELVAQDLANKAMSIQQAEKKIKEYADGHKTGNFACVTPVEADKILRKFYGLPAPGADENRVQPTQTEPVSAESGINLEDFF